MRTGLVGVEAFLGAPVVGNGISVGRLVEVDVEGAVVGGVGGFFAGRSAGGEQEFCQEIETCEDINM